MAIDIGRMIKSLRQERRLSQRELAEKLSISQQAVAKYESNAARPSYESLEARADLVIVPITFFLKTEDLPPEIRQSRELYHLRQAVHDDPDMLVLFDLAKQCTPQELRQTIAIIKALTGESV